MASQKIKSFKEIIAGTNCLNCSWANFKNTAAVTPDELNSQGGLNISKDNMAKAKHSDLITLPGKAQVVNKFWCDHKDVDQYVTERMCCKYWDAEGTKRDWK